MHPEMRDRVRDVVGLVRKIVSANDRIERARAAATAAIAELEAALAEHAELRTEIPEPLAEHEHARDRDLRTVAADLADSDLWPTAIGDRGFVRLIGEHVDDDILVDVLYPTEARGADTASNRTVRKQRRDALRDRVRRLRG